MARDPIASITASSPISLSQDRRQRDRDRERRALMLRSS